MANENTNNEIGKLTPEELQKLTAFKHDTAQYLQKLGEFEVMKARILVRLDQMEQEGQAVMAEVAKRLNLSPGQQWQATLDGTICVSPLPDEESE